MNTSAAGTWVQITCEDREALVSRNGGRYDGFKVVAGRTDMDGQFGEPTIFTEWYDSLTGSDESVLRDYRYPGRRTPDALTLCYETGREPIYGKPFHGWSCDCDECKGYDERGEPRPGEAPRPQASAACPYREPTEREKEQARVIVGRIVTAFGNKIRGGDAQAREHAEWVVAGFPWAFQGSTPHRDLGVDVQPHVDPWDDAPVTFPRGLLALLVEAATKADLANLLGSECESDPCPVCTALVEGYEAVHPSD